MQDTIYNFDWKSTSLGPVDTWSPSLKTTVEICANSIFPVLILWGKDYVQIYNDAYAELIGTTTKRLGKRAKDSWQERNWNDVSALLENVFAGARSYQLERHKFISAKGNTEERYYTISYNPIYNDHKTVGGIFLTVKEDPPLESSPLTYRLPSANNDRSGISILRGKDLLIESVNDKLLQLLLKRDDEVYGKPFPEVVDQADQKNFRSLLRKAFDTGERVVINELIHNLNTKEKISIRIIFEPIRGKSGLTEKIVVIMQDNGADDKLTPKEFTDTTLSLAIEAANIGTFEWNLQTGAFRHSSRLAEIFGYPPAENLEHKDFQQRIHQEDAEIRSAAHKRALENGKLFYEARVIWPDKSVHWLRMNGKVVLDESGSASMMFGTAIDITDQKEISESLHKKAFEQAIQLQQQLDRLKKSEERYHKMVEEVQEYAIILLNRDGYIENWNKGAEQIKGYKEHEILGKHFSIFYSADDQRAKLPQYLLNQAVATGKAVHEGYRVRKDGTRFWGSISITALHGENNEIIGFSKVTKDLTERKQSEDEGRALAETLRMKNEALRASEERYHKMIAEVQDYAIVLLNSEGIVQNWNVGAESIKGYKASEIVGKSFKEFYTPEDRNNGLPDKLLDQARTKGKALQEGWRVRKDGTRFWGSIVITALHNEMGGIIGFSKVTRDLTERKHTEDKLKQYTLELEAQNRELEQFAYVASHDLQEPLRKIQTFTDILQRNVPADENSLKYFEKIKTAAKRMTELIKSVLNYSRLTRETEAFANVNLADAVENAIGDFELVILEKNAIIEHHGLPIVNAIPLQVNQLFTNLIGNALKFNHNTPRVTIQSRLVTAAQFAITPPDGLREGKYFEITVSDNGIGFDQKFADQIFGMFQRLHGKQTYAGTGIGLALCKKIMENHNGFIGVKSSLGEGSTFYVYFPAKGMAAA